MLGQLDDACKGLEKLLTEKPVNQPVVEQSTGWVGGGVQRLRNFFSPATRIQAANSTASTEEQAEIKPAVAHLGK